MAHYLSFTFGDYSKEKSSVRVFHGAVTLASIAGFLDQIEPVRTAMDGITRGTIQKEMWVGDETILSQEYPTDPLAQRELKWLVTYQGDTSLKLYQFAIPTADPAGVDGSSRARLLEGSDVGNLLNTQMAALVTAVEDIGRTPDDDEETITVRSIRLVGRNI